MRGFRDGLARGGRPHFVWMHAATRRCGYPADSSDLAAGAAGAATSTPSLLRCRPAPNHGLRLMPGPVPAGDPVSGPFPLSLTYQRARPSATGPRGRAPTVSAKG